MKNEFILQNEKKTNHIMHELYAKIIQDIPNVNLELIDAKNPFLKIPDENKYFGSIEIHLGLREFTVIIGNKFHTHFDIDIYSEDDTEQVIVEIIEFIADILNDKINLLVSFRNEKVVSSSLVYEESIEKLIETTGTIKGLINKIFQLQDKIMLYSWSGTARRLN